MKNSKNNSKQSEAKAPKGRIRASSLAIKTPVSFTPAKKKDGPAYNLGWDELRVRLELCWEACRRLANLAVRELARNDEPPLPGQKMGDMPAFPKGGLYGRLMTKGGPRAEGEWVRWIGAAQSANAIVRSVQSRYMRDRVHAYATGRISLPSYAQKRYALPIHQAAWSGEATGGTIRITFPLPAVSLALLPDEAKRKKLQERLGGRDTLPEGRATVELKGGKDRARQWRDVLAILAGKIKQSEMQVYRQGSAGQTKGIKTDREPGGGQRQGTHLMMRFIVQEPGAKVSQATATMLLRSDVAAFLVAEIEGQGGSLAYTHNADHVRRSEQAVADGMRRAGMSWEDMRKAIEGHAGFRERLALDRRHEGRTTRGQRRQHKDVLGKRCEKHRRRLDTFVKQQASVIAGVCERRGVGRVLCDFNIGKGSRKGYFRTFPWAAFQSQLRRKLEEAGIVMEAGREDVNDSEDEGCDLATESMSAAEAAETDSLAAVLARGAKAPRRRGPAAGA